MYNIIFSIYDSNRKYVGFSSTEEDAKEMANKYDGHYDWEFVSPNSEGLRYVSPEVGYVDQDEEYY
jgi:hypothetical protein